MKKIFVFNFACIILFAGCTVQKRGGENLSPSLTDSITFHAATFPLDGHTVFFSRKRGFYAFKYGNHPKVAFFDPTLHVQDSENINVSEPYNIQLVDDSNLIVSSASKINIKRLGGASKTLRFPNSLVDSYYVYIYYLENNGRFYNQNKNWVYLQRIPKSLNAGYHSLVAFPLKNYKIGKGKTIVSLPQPMKDTFYYSRDALFSIGPHNNLFYGFRYYDYLYKCTAQGHKLDSISLSDVLPCFEPSPFPREKFGEMAFINKFFVTAPMLLSINYDSFRKCIHLFIKCGQPLQDKDGRLNEQEDADIYWVVLDADLNVLSKTKIKNNFYFKLENPLITPKGVGLRRKSYNDEKVTFDIYTF